LKSIKIVLIAIAAYFQIRGESVINMQKTAYIILIFLMCVGMIK